MSLIDNKKARFNYEIQEKFEAGLELIGQEVKSLRNGRGSLIGAFISIRGGEAFLIGAEIPAYQPKNAGDDYDPKRVRKILLNKKEILQLASFEKERGLTLIPISFYNKGRNIKLSFAVARGKKKEDKRQTIMRREAERDMGRSLKKLR